MEARPGCRRGSGGPAHGERRGARALSAAPLAARRRPPDSVPSAAPSGRRREPPRSSQCGAQRPRRQLLLSHHLAVTASQKRPHLAAAGARDGRGHRPRLGGLWQDGVGRDPGARRAGRGGLWAGRGDSEAKGPGSRRREAGRASRPHPPPAALNGSARTLGLASGRRLGLPSARPRGEPSPSSRPVLSLPPSPTCRSVSTSRLLLARATSPPVRCTASQTGAEEALWRSGSGQSSNHFSGPSPLAAFSSSATLSCVQVGAGKLLSSKLN